jgi:lipopolysaccharide/colanic/teichoic acid biosynthesis glycosyltransferase
MFLRRPLSARRRRGSHADAPFLQMMLSKSTGPSRGVSDWDSKAANLMSLSGYSSDRAYASRALRPPPRRFHGPDAGRLFDIAVALAALLFTAPLLLGIALLVKLQDGGPVVFAHTRVGRNGATFRCLKFRTMRIDAEQALRDLLAADPQARAEWAADQKLRRDPRITRFGGFLRKSSLDELMQIFNVLRGEMSIVGPRPIVPAEIARYGRAYFDYCSVRPGITGLWQISGRNDVTYRRRVALDKLYVQSKSVGLDIGIILKTVVVVLTRRGSY